MRLLRLLIATGSFAIIAFVYQPDLVQGQYSCYACITSCGYPEVACETSCGGGPAGSCFDDEFNFCSGESKIVECGAN